MTNTNLRNITTNTQQGFTLVELIIALVIGLVLLLVVGTVFTSSRQAFRVQEDNSRIQEAGRFALEILGRSIKQAGYAEIPFSGFKVMFSGTAITGTNGAAGAADTLTVQYDAAIDDRDCEGGKITEDEATAADTAGATMQIRNHFNIDAGNAELQCEGVNDADIDINLSVSAPGAPPAGQPLLDNVEDLQVFYGIDTTGDQSANQYVVALADDDWDLVVTARVCVLIRSNEPNIVSAGSNYRDCNGVLVVSNNRHLRRAFTGTFNLRNRVNVLP